MRLSVGIILILLSVAAFLLGLMFSTFYDRAAGKAVLGMSFVYFGPIFVLGLALIHSKLGGLGRFGLVWYMVAVLCCMSGAYPALHRAQIIDGQTLIDTFGFGVLVLLGMLVWFWRMGTSQTSLDPADHP